jgi:uncharacterized coiled-coil DUF342 family protein
MMGAARAPSSPEYRSLLLAARNLLIDVERADTGVQSPEAGQALSCRSDASAAQKSKEADGGTERDRKHKSLLLLQIDELRATLAAEQLAAAHLRDDNAQLAHDLRSLASQLKQERAASKAVLTAQHSVAGQAGGADGGGGSGELTLASAASQILLLRREVKFLQKQWNSARVDQSSATTREQMQQLREEADEARRKAAAAEEAAASHAARSRILVRELRAARAQMKAQQQRMQQRSSAQRDVATLKEQLITAQDQFVAQQQRLKALELRERLRGGPRDPVEREDDDDEDGDDDDEEGDSGTGGAGSGSSRRGGNDATRGRYDMAAVEAEAAHSSLGLLLLARELQNVERAWMAEKGGAAELIAIKANMSFQIVQVEDDNNELRAEVAKLREKVGAMQEERAVMLTNLNALNMDLANAPEEKQAAAAEAVAAMAIQSAAPPPPPPPPPPEKKPAQQKMGEAAKGMGDKLSKNFKSFARGKQKKSGEEPPPPPPPPPQQPG